MPRDATPETEAVGLDVSALLGLTPNEICQLLPEEALALVAANVEPPTGWPSQLLKHNIDHSAVTFYYQDSDGLWHPCSSYDLAAFASVHTVPAFIYTRRPVATPGILIRPIVSLLIGADGRCHSPSAMLTDVIIAMGRDRSLPLYSTHKALLPENTATHLHEIEQHLRLSPPPLCTQAHSFGTSDANGLPVQLLVSSERDALLICNGSGSPRVRIEIAGDRSSEAIFCDSHGVWPSLKLGPAGLRIECVDEARTTVRRVDVFTNTSVLLVDSESGTHSDVVAMLILEACQGNPCELVIICANAIVSQSEHAGDEDRLRLTLEFSRSAIVIAGSDGVAELKSATQVLPGLIRASFV